MSQRVSIVLAVFLAVSSLLSAPVLGGWNGGKKCNGGCGRKLSAGGASGHGGSGGSHYWWQDSKPFSTPNHGKTVSLGGNGGSQHQQQGSWGSQPQQQPQQPQQHGGSWGSQQPSQTYGPPPPSGGCGGGNGGGCGQPKQQPQVYPQQPQVYPQQPQVVPPGPPQVQPSNTVCNPGYECVPYHLCENGVVVSGGGLGLDLRSPPKQLRALGSPCGNNQVCCQSAPQDSYNKQQQPAVVPPGPPQQGCGGGGCGQQQQSYVPPPAASAPVPQQTYGPPQPSGGCGGGHGGGCGQPQPAPRPSTGCSGVGCLQPQPQPGFVAPVQQAPVAPKPSFGGGGGALLISSKPYTNKVPVATGSGCGPGTPGCGQPIPQQQPYQAPQPAPYQPPQPAPQPAPYQPPQPAPQPAPYQPPQPAPQPAAPYQPPQQQQPYPAPQGCSPGAPGCSQPAPQVYQPAPQPSKPNYQPQPAPQVYQPAPQPSKPNYQPQPAPQPKPSYPAPQQSGGCGPGKPGCSQPPQQQYQPAPSGGQFQNVAPPQQKPYPATGGCGGNGGAGGCGQPPRPGNNYQPQRPAQPFPAPSQGGQVQRPYPAQQRPSVPSQNSINGGYNAGRQESATYKPYTGPTAPSVPFPGCSAGLLCVEYNFCNATGYIIPAPDPVDAQVTYRVAVMDCSNPETNIIGVCCRDPNYVDPWPQGMMMSGPGMSGAGMKKLGKRDVAAVLAEEQATPKLNDKLSDSLDVDVVGEGSAGVESSEKKAPEASPVEEKEQFVADAPEPAAAESEVVSHPAEEKKDETEVNQVSNDDAQETKQEEVPAADPVVEKTEVKQETEEPKAEQNEEIGLAKRPAPGFPAAIKPKPADEKHEEKDESQKPEEKDDKKAISTRPSPGFPEKTQEAADEASPVEEKPAEVPAEKVEAPVEEKPTNDDGEVIPELLHAEEKKEEVDNHNSVQEQEKAGDETITDITDDKEPADKVAETQAPVKDEKVADEIAERNDFEKVEDVASDAAEEEKIPVDKKESIAPKQGAPSPFNLTRADVPSTKPTPGVIPTGQQQPAVLPPAPAVLPPIAPGFVESCGEYHDCVPYYQCDESGFIITDGSGILDLRQKPLPSALPERKCYPSDPSIGAEGASFVCCRQPPVEVCPKSEICVEGNVCPGLLTNGDGLIDPRLQPKSCILDSYRELYGVCCDPSPPVPQHCGVRNPDGVAFPAVPDLVDRIQNPSLLPANEARFAEFPWQAMIYKNLSPPTKPGGKAEAQFVCGATLISDRVLLTAAHCIKNYTVYDLEIRLGEWEINNQIEPLAYVDHRIAQIAVHPEYKAGPEFNDIAVLILEAPIVRDHHINTICLPDNPLETFSGRRCIATGWGKDAFDGVYQHVMKKVDLPVVQHADCQKYLRKTRLGNYFRLHYNFLCAGGEVNKDACTGDGGGPLVCPRADGRYVLAGITSWGIGCGKPDVPGVYAKVTSFLEWIHTVTANSTTASKPAVVPPGPTSVPSIPLPSPVVRSGISEKAEDQVADKQVVLPVEDKTDAVKNNLPETR